MKHFTLTFLSVFAMAIAPAAAEDALEKHAKGTEKLADEQDELSADVQQLILEQTVPQVIELFEEVEGIMGEATDFLIELDTGGKTIAAQTEIIEKIRDAAKARQQQQGSGEAGGAMMDMMERMMGEGEGEGEKPGQGEGGEEGEGEGEEGGQGQTGESDSANTANQGATGASGGERRIAKAAGQAGKSLPTEFQSALDAYNRGLEGIGK